MTSANASGRRRWAVVVVAVAIGLCVVLGAAYVLWRMPAEASLPPADGAYTLRGVLVNLPKGVGVEKYIKIHHENLPGFKDRNGVVVGMGEMTMDFEQVDPRVRLGEFREGDPVEFTFEVRWKPRVVSRVTMMRKLGEGERPAFGSGSK